MFGAGTKNDFLPSDSYYSYVPWRDMNRPLTWISSELSRYMDNGSPFTLFSNRGALGPLAFA